MRELSTSAITFTCLKKLFRPLFARRPPHAHPQELEGQEEGEVIEVIEVTEGIGVIGVIDPAPGDLTATRRQEAPLESSLPTSVEDVVAKVAVHLKAEVMRGAADLDVAGESLVGVLIGETHLQAVVLEVIDHLVEVVLEVIEHLVAVVLEVIDHLVAVVLEVIDHLVAVALEGVDSVVAVSVEGDVVPLHPSKLACWYFHENKNLKSNKIRENNTTKFRLRVFSQTLIS